MSLGTKAGCKSREMSIVVSLGEILDQGRHVRGFWSRDEGCTSQCSLE